MELGRTKSLTYWDQSALVLVTDLMLKVIRPSVKSVRLLTFNSAGNWKKMLLNMKEREEFLSISIIKRVG